MDRTRLILGLLAASAVALSPSLAVAQSVVPPGNSAVTQYTETVPTAGGEASAGKGKRSPAKVLGTDKAKQLEAQGPQGQEAATVAAATAPVVISAPESAPAGHSHAEGAKPRDKNKNKTAGGGSIENPRATSPSAGSVGGGPRLAESNGSSGLGEVVGQAVGSSSSGQSGLLLPLVVLATVFWAFAYLRRRKRRTA
ncbi:MAG TPA: hypothetical protein VII45_09955 [Solirubrobacterales bacterium]